MKEYKKLIAKRWWNIILYSLLAAAVVKLVAAPLTALLVKKLGFDDPFKQGLLAFISLSIVFGLCKELKLIHIKVWQYSFWSHPPVWVGALLGIIWLNQFYVPSHSSSLVYAVSFFALLLSIFLILGSKHPEASYVEALNDVPDLHQDLGSWSVEELSQWVNAELPVCTKDTSSNKLLFGYDQVVKRMYNRLIAKNANQHGCPTNKHRSPKSLALVGDLGSGKSSVINTLIKKIYESTDTWVIVKVDAWSRDPKTIDEQILELVIDELAKFTDVIGYRGVPGRYHKALSSHGGWWAFFSHLAGGESSVEDKLKSIDNLLLMIGKNLLIIIEDPDRGDEAQLEVRKERILALMDRLQQFTSDRIKVIITGSKTLFNADYRVIEFKEELPTPSKEYAAILNELVQKCWLQGGTLILPNGTPHFDASEFPYGTPREFKHVIRDVNALWYNQSTNTKGELYGAIDLKQLVMLSFIKERTRNAFDYIQLRLIEGKPENRFFYDWPEHHKNHIKIPSPLRNEEFANKMAEADESNKKSQPDKNISQADEIWNDLKQCDKKEFDAWVRIVTFDGLQSIINIGRIDYFDRFMMRSTLGFYASDVDKASLNTYEKLNDQEYLTAIDRVYNQLKHNGSLTDDYLEDVKKCIYAGHLSPYLYKLMKGEKLQGKPDAPDALGLAAWQALADKIIAIMPNIEYVINDRGHPAGRHLVEIIEYLFIYDESMAFNVARKAVDSQCSAGGDIFMRTSQLHKRLKDISNSQAIWPLFRSALINDNIVPVNIFEGENPNWLFVEVLQERLNSGLEWVTLLKAYIEAKATHSDNFKLFDELDITAINKVIKLFEALQEFGPMTFMYRGSLYTDRAKWKLIIDERDEYITGLKALVEKGGFEITVES